jgi:hypothetical protein
MAFPSSLLGHDCGEIACVGRTSRRSPPPRLAALFKTRPDALSLPFPARSKQQRLLAFSVLPLRSLRGARAPVRSSRERRPGKENVAVVHVREGHGWDGMAVGICHQCDGARKIPPEQLLATPTTPRLIAVLAGCYSAASPRRSLLRSLTGPCALGRWPRRPGRIDRWSMDAVHGAPVPSRSRETLPSTTPPE